MAWIESHVDVGDHPKTFDLAERLGIGVAQAVGHLHLLWHFALKFAWQDGNLDKFSATAIARGAHWAGDAKTFVEALQASGWLDGMKIHDWLDFCGDLVKKKIEYQDRRRKRVGDFPRNLGEPPETLGLSQRTNPTNQTIPNHKDSLVQSPETLELAERLKGLILANNPKAKIPESLAVWAQDADRMLRLDKRTRQELEQVMDFCQRDSFWKANILSMAKLRKQFDQLWLKMNAGGDREQQSNHNAGAAKPIPGKYAHISKS